MAGLLDFLREPEGQGLLSAAFAGLAGARRGQPLNTLGAAGLAGLTGYAGAQDRQSALADAAQAKQLREMQIQQMRTALADDAATREILKRHYGDSGMPAAPTSGGPGLPASMTSSLPSEMQTGAQIQPVQGYQPPPKVDLYARYRGLGDSFASAGLAAKAKEQYDLAEKFRPKFNTTPQQMVVGGRLQNVLVSEDGLVKTLDGYEVPRDPNKPFSLGNNNEPVPNLPFQQYEIGKTKAGAPSMTAINNVQAFEPFANKMQGEMAGTLVKRFDALQSAPATIQALDKAKAMAATASPFVGSGADTKLAAVKFFNNNLGTNISPDAVRDAETLRSTLFASVMENLKKMDASPSQQQQQVLQDAFGRLTTDPKALPQIIDFWKGQVESSVAEHNRRVDQAQSGPAKVAFPYDIRVQLPQAQTSPRVQGQGAPNFRWNPTTRRLEQVN